MPAVREYEQKQKGEKYSQRMRERERDETGGRSVTESVKKMREMKGRREETRTRAAESEEVEVTPVRTIIRPIKCLKP